MSIDAFLKKRYNRETYNCAHFASEVWESLTGESIGHKLAGLLEPPKSRHVRFDLRRQFVRLEAPESPCLALMQRRGSATGTVTLSIKYSILVPMLVKAMQELHADFDGRLMALEA